MYVAVAEVWSRVVCIMYVAGAQVVKITVYNVCSRGLIFQDQWRLLDVAGDGLLKGSVFEVCRRG